MEKQSKTEIYKFAGSCAVASIPLLLYEQLQVGLGDMSMWVSIGMPFALFMFLMGLLFGYIAKEYMKGKQVSLKARTPLIIGAIMGFAVFLWLGMISIYFSNRMDCSSGINDAGCKSFWLAIDYFGIKMMLLHSLSGAIAGGVMGYSFCRYCKKSDRNVPAEPDLPASYKKNPLQQT